MEIGKTEYLEQAAALSVEEQQRVLSRMSGKLPHQLIREKLSVEEAVAIQLEIEDEQLSEWRKNWRRIKERQAAVNGATNEQEQACRKTARGG